MEKRENEYPNIKQLRKLQEDHGPLIEVLWSNYSSGMMMGSVARSSIRIYRENGEVRVMNRDMRVYEPEYTSVYEADEGLLEKLQNISDRENLPLWGLLKADPQKTLQVLDYSSVSTITLTYDACQIGDRLPLTVCFSWEAVRQQNVTEVWEEIVGILKEGIVAERLLESSSEPNPYGNPFGPANNERPENREPVFAEDGSWTCPSCGKKGNTGKFCCECGSRKPDRQAEG